MPTKKKIDGKKLIEMVQGGVHQKEIMKVFKFRTAAQLKTNYLDALVDNGQAPEIKAGREKIKETPQRDVVIGKRGSLILPKVMIDEMGFAEGNQFIVRKTKAGISLKLVDA